MEHRQYDIFISYRRKDTCEKAEHLNDLLEGLYGKRISFDRENLTGIFDVELIRRIDRCKDFLLVVGKNTFEYTEKDYTPERVELYRYLGSCPQKEFDAKISEMGPYADIDFVRIEVARALNNKQARIIPIVPERTSEFNFQAVALPPDIADLKRREAVTYSDSPDALFKSVVPSLRKHMRTRPRSVARVAALCLILLLCGGAFAGWQMGVKHKKTSLMERIGQTEVVQSLGIKWSPDIKLAELRAVGEILEMMEPVEGGATTVGAWREADGGYHPDVDLDFETPAYADTVESFWMSHFEVSRSQWQALMAGDKCTLDEELLPVADISYDEACAFAKRLTNLTGLVFALPSEAEWEYAARAGARQQRTRYAGSDNADSVAWYEANSGGQAHPCDGTKYPNGGDMFDMSGNVYEWTSTPFRPLSGDPTVPDSDAMVIRGGSYASPAAHVRVTHRDLMNRHEHSPEVGIRLIIKPYAE